MGDLFLRREQWGQVGDGACTGPAEQEGDEGGKARIGHIASGSAASRDRRPRGGNTRVAG